MGEKRGGLSDQHFEVLEAKLIDHSLPRGTLEAAFIDSGAGDEVLFCGQAGLPQWACTKAPQEGRLGLA